MKRMCNQFTCKERTGNYCCADCYKRQRCDIVCKNSPDRCGLAAGEGSRTKKAKAEMVHSPISGLTGLIAADRAARFEQMARLYDQGLNDVRIAEATGASKEAVYHWRRRTGRKANDWRGRKRRSDHA